jgi:serine/threonine protein phosphatase PrpC
MGSTVAMVAAHGERAIVAHAGDSRVYRLRAGVLDQLTRDHSFVEELEARGRLPADDRARIAAQFAHVITRAVGIGAEVEPTLREIELERGDRLLLCTDGLHGVLDRDEIADTLSIHSPHVAAEALVARALEAGSTDNVTAVVAHAI